MRVTPGTQGVVNAMLVKTLGSAFSSAWHYLLSLTCELDTAGLLHPTFKRQLLCLDSKMRNFTGAF